MVSHRPEPSRQPYAFWVPSVRRHVYLLCSYGPSPSPHLTLMDSNCCLRSIYCIWHKDADGSQGDEMRERKDPGRLEDLEEGGRRANAPAKLQQYSGGAQNFCNLVLGPVFVLVFVLTFLCLN